MTTHEQLEQDFSRWQLPGMALHRFMDELRERGPIARISYYGTPAFLVTSHDALARSFKDTENLPPERPYQIGIAPLIGENFQSMSGERHRLYRKLATPTGHGPRMCPGMHLARTNLRTTLDVLLERLPRLQLLREEGAAPSGTIFRHPDALPCSF